MLKKLDNKQVGEYWNEIKPAIRKAFPRQPRDVEDWLNKLLEKILRDEGQVWIGLDEVGKVVFILVTLFIEDPCSGSKQLLVYSLFGYRLVEDKLWKKSQETLKTFALDSKCNELVAYSEVERVVDIAKKTGADVSTTFIQWRLR